MEVELLPCSVAAVALGGHKVDMGYPGLTEARHDFGVIRLRWETPAKTSRARCSPDSRQSRPRILSSAGSCAPFRRAAGISLLTGQPACYTTAERALRSQAALRGER
jgi:hypothetical protein